MKPIIRCTILCVLIAASLAAAQSWEAAAPFPTDPNPRLWATGLNVDGSLVALGGKPYSTDGDNNASVHLLPLGGTTWQQMPFLNGPIIRQQAGIDALGRIIVFAGVDGIDPEGDKGAAFWYDLTEGDMGEVAQRSALAPFDYVASATDDLGRIYSIGGGPGPAATPANPNSNRIERYDGIADAWTVLSPMPNAVADASAVFDARGHVLVFGGIDATATARTANVAQYDIAAGAWSDTVVPDMPVALSGMRAVVGADERVYILGGESGPIGAGTVVNTVYVLHLDTLEWSTGPEMITARKSFAAALGADDYIYAMGGSTTADGATGTYLVEKLYTPPCPVVTQQPASRGIWAGMTATFSAVVTGGGTLDYQWRRDGTDIFDGSAPGGGTISGTQTVTLSITLVGEADAGVYELLIANACGETLSDPAELTVLRSPALPPYWSVASLHPGWAHFSNASGADEELQVGSTYYDDGGYLDLQHPVLWSGTAASAVDLTPPDSVGGGVNETAAGVQVGWWWWPYQCWYGGEWHTCYTQQACLWLGDAASHINMQVTGYEYSSIADTDGLHHVGTGTWDDDVGNYYSRALLWTGTSGSYISLHPAAERNSFGVALDGDQQYGFVHTQSFTVQAAMWSGSAASYVNLHPAGASRSYVNGAGDAQAVGSGEFGGSLHALLWGDSATSVIDLHPAGADASEAYDAAGGVQVGQASVAGVTGAALWTASAESCVDLHAFVPPEFLSSYARGVYVAADGTITVVGSGYNSATGRTEALLWTSLPRHPADLDADGDVDLADYRVLFDCLTGPAGELPPGCDEADYDADGDVDLGDVGEYWTAYDAVQ